jgi:hypothetical protein
MSDVVAVALISSGASLLTATGGAIATYKVSLRSSQTTIVTAEAQKDVELAKLEAENEKLRDSTREDERRNRQSTYHQHLNGLIALFQMMGTATESSKVEEVCDNYRYLHAGVVLFAPSSVREGAYAVNDAYGKIWPALAQQRKDHPDKPGPDCWRDATASLQNEFGGEIVNLTSLMHADVTRGITDESETGEQLVSPAAGARPADGSP